MVKKAIMAVVCGIMLVAFNVPAIADNNEITPQRVVEYVEKSVKLILEVGEEAAFPLLSDPHGAYVDGDLYVFTYNMDGTIIQHLRPKLVGMNMMNVMDKKGKCIGCDFVRIAKEEEKGWSEYWWPKPSTKKICVKTSYIMKVPGMERFVGAGVYDLTKDDAKKAIAMVK